MTELHTCGWCDEIDEKCKCDKEKDKLRKDNLTLEAENRILRLHNEQLNRMIDGMKQK